MAKCEFSVKEPGYNRAAVPRLSYCCAALLLGAFWYVAWLVSALPRFPHTYAQLRFLEPLDFFEPMFLLMCAVSLTLAVAFRRFIVRADTLPRALATAIGLPLLGSVLYVAGFYLPNSFIGAESFSSFLYSLLMLPLLGVIVGLPVAAAGFWIFLPMGLVSQLVMGAIGRGKLSSADGRLFVLASASVAAAVAYAAGFVPFR